MTQGFHLIDMKTHLIVGTYETEEVADKVRDELGPPKHCVPVGGTWDELNAADLAKIYNQLPGVKPVKRFSDREAAVRRLNAALANPGKAQEEEPGDEPAQQPTTTNKPVDKIWDTPEQEQKLKAKSKTKKTTTPRASARADSPTTVAVTATGKKDSVRFNEGSPRSKVFAKIKEAEELLITELTKRCSGFVNKSQLMGCIQKLKAKGYIKVS